MSRSNAIEFRCPDCRELLSGFTHDARNQVSCPQCGSVIEIPSTSEAISRLRTRQTRISFGLQEPLPGICICCGAPADFAKKLVFQSSDDFVLNYIFLLPLLLLLGEITVDWRSPERVAQVFLPLCQSHRYHFGWRKWLIVVTPLLPLALFLLGLPFEVIVAAPCLWIVLLMVLSLTGVRVKEVRLSMITLAGVSEDFAEELQRMRSARAEPKQPMQGERDLFDFS